MPTFVRRNIFNIRSRSIIFILVNTPMGGKLFLLTATECFANIINFSARLWQIFLYMQEKNVDLSSEKLLHLLQNAESLITFYLCYVRYLMKLKKVLLLPHETAFLPFTHCGNFACYISCRDYFISIFFSMEMKCQCSQQIMPK